MTDLRWRFVSAIVSVIAAVAFGIVLFASAGTFDWPGAWIWLAMLIVSSAIFTPTMDAGLIKERLTGVSRARKRMTTADVWGGVTGVLFATWLPLMGLDAIRYRWSTVPGWTQIAGAIVFVAANVLIYFAARANRFASSAVRVQDDRGQTVVTDGPYAVVRHPMYSGAVLYFIGTALVLGSLVGLAFTALIVLPLAFRTWFEDRMLQGELAGYAEYTQRVRYRLIPRVW